MNKKIRSTPSPDFDPSRRNLLRNALVAGCALYLPITWAAETTPGKAQQVAAEQSHKISKAQVKYQNKPKGKQHCAVCVNFIAPHSCRLVEGKINPNGWCTLFSPKPA